MGRQAAAADDVLWRREGEGSWKGMVSDGLLWMHVVDSCHASPSERLSNQRNMLEAGYHLNNPRRISNWQVHETFT